MPSRNYTLPAFIAGIAAIIFIGIGCEDDSDQVTRFDGATGGEQAVPIQTGPAAGTEPGGALAITPSDFTLTTASTDPADLAGAKIQFIVTGGTPPYGQWRVSTPWLGTINTYTGEYTASGGGTGDNTISITDSAGNIATVTVAHEVAEAEEEQTEE